MANVASSPPSDEVPKVSVSSPVSSSSSSSSSQFFLTEMMDRLGSLDSAITLPLMSLPFLLGGYIGYRRALTNEEFSSTWSNKAPPSRLSSGSSPMSSPPRSSLSSSSSSSSSSRGGVGGRRPGGLSLPSSPSSSSFSPARHAGLALVFGTLLCLGGSGFVIGGLSLLAGVKNVDEGVAAMRNFGRRVRGGIERTIGKDPTAPRTEEDKREREVVAKMTYKEEAEYFENKIFGQPGDADKMDERTKNPDKVKCGGVGGLP